MITQTVTPRISFNWGFHDGALASKLGKPNQWVGVRHPNVAYKLGYTDGFRSQRDGESTESSQEAWDFATMYGDL